MPPTQVATGGLVEMHRTDEVLRVVVADDDPLTRRVLRDALQAAGVVVIAEARDGREAVELALHYEPDIVLLDVVMPGVDGLEATRAIAAAGARSKVVLLSSAEDPELVMTGLRIGACGFLAKSVEPESLPQALRGARDGEAVLSRAMTMHVVERLRTLPASASGLRPVRSELTAREWEVLDLLCEGRDLDDVAAELFLADETVRSHVKSILRKLGVHSRGEAVDEANRIRGELLASAAS